jgi:hypothetical protein
VTNSFDDVLRQAGAILPDGFRDRFTPMSSEEAKAFTRRFRVSNMFLGLRWGVRLPVASTEELDRDDRGARERIEHKRRLLNARMTARNASATYLAQYHRFFDVLPTPALHVDPPIAFGIEGEHSRTIGSEDGVRVRGWGVVPNDHVPLDAAGLLVDDARVIPVSYGVHRADAAAYLNASNPYIGIDVQLRGRDFGTGTHAVRIIGAAGNPSRAYVSENALTLSVEGG